MYPITTGDGMHLIGGFGGNIDYTVRLNLKMIDEIDGSILREAVSKTQQRYPYLSLRLHKNERDYYYEDNPTPIVVFHTDGKISLNAEESNYHVWAVCYNEDRLYLDFSHGIADGTGMYMVLSTLLYYYCAERYGVTDHSGIRTLEDPILPEESIDPLDTLPQIDLSLTKRPQTEPAFSLIMDGGLTEAEPNIWDIEIPESAFIPFSSEHDASPGTMVSILVARALDDLFPKRDNQLIGGYVVNARPMLHAPLGHHNMVTNILFPYTDRIKAMPLDRQCTVHRGTTFIKSDEVSVRNMMIFSSSFSKSILQNMPSVEAKKQAFKQTVFNPKRQTYNVSYVGQWKHKALSPYILEFWTHVPSGSGGMLIEIAAINEKVFLSVHQNFREDVVIKSFLRQLDENSIPYKVKGPLASDIPHFPEPEMD